MTPRVFAVASVARAPSGQHGVLAVFPVVPPCFYTDTFGAARDGGSRRHEGVDIITSLGMPVFAVVEKRRESGQD